MLKSPNKLLLQYPKPGSCIRRPRVSENIVAPLSQWHQWKRMKCFIREMNRHLESTFGFRHDTLHWLWRARSFAISGVSSCFHVLAKTAIPSSNVSRPLEISRVGLDNYMTNGMVAKSYAFNVRRRMLYDAACRYLKLQTFSSTRVTVDYVHPSSASYSPRANHTADL